MFTLIFGSVSRLFHKWDTAAIDNHIFRLHYRSSVIILLAAICVVTPTKLIDRGGHIHCMSDSIDSKVMDVYCWIHSTYSVNDKFNGSQGVDYPHPGLGEDDVRGDRQGWTHHKYYQWVVFVLALQAGCFYLPRLLWKTAEGGVMKLLTSGLTGVDSFMDKGTRNEGVKLISNYYNLTPSRRGTYFMKFVFCELLNLVNVFSQIYFTDMFLGYQFTKFGRDVLAVSEEDLNTRVDPMDKVFPKIAKCQFKKYGPTGTIQNHDALCVLPLNIVNEKVFIFLYFWLVFLAAINCVWLIYRLLTIASLSLRVNVIFARSDKRVEKEVIAAALANPKHSATEQLGDYLMLYFITKNVNPLILKDVFDKISPLKYEGNDDELAALQKSSAPEMPSSD